MPSGHGEERGHGARGLESYPGPRDAVTGHNGKLREPVTNTSECFSTNMKRKADDDPHFNGNVKLIKTEKDASSADYSQDVKKKINASNRTGQACDRCRVRKMRCDDQPEGCGPCMQNQTECKTTDRITGKATVRGYVQSLERRLQELENRNRALQSRLMSLGVDVKPGDQYTDPATTSLLQWHENQRLGNRPGWEGNAQGMDPPKQDGATSRNTVSDGSSASIAPEDRIRLPNFRSGLAGNNYLGVSTGNSLLSSIRGTSMNVLGMEIDLADYMSPDLDEPDPSSTSVQPVYNKSYRAFVQTAFGTSPKLDRVELPPRSEGMNYAHVFFRVTNPYIPIVHKPSFMATLSQIYDDPAFEPSVAETVMVHTMFAIMYCQYAARAPQNANHQAELNQSSNFHYHYALGFFAQLVASHTLADLQALTMLCLHIRNLPKPGACWTITSITLSLAIELGLHRSAKRWPPTTKRSILEIEIRKRVFWSILVIHVIVAGNLGRPMALRSDDWDVEMPEAIDDELLSDNGIDTSRPGKCNFLVGSQTMCLMPVYMDLYNNIYAVKRSPETYVETVLRLERQIREWSEKWPWELVHESASDNELGRVHGQYLAIWPLHIRLLLRHPSLSLSSSPEFNSENLTVCIEVSGKMLHHVRQLQKYKSLDGTWQTSALYVLAIATTLFGHWERRDQLTAHNLASLREDMDAWLSIIGDMSSLLGSGKQLQDAVRVPIDNTLSHLSQHLSSKIASSALSTPKQNASSKHVIPPKIPPTQDAYGQNTAFPSYIPPNEGVRNPSHPSTPHNTFLPPPSTNIAINTSAAYQNPSQYSYHPPYAHTPPSYQAPSYATTEALPATAAAANAYLNNYQPAPQHSHNFPPNQNNTAYNNYHSPGSPTSWRHWAGNMASNLEPGPEYMSSASALMQLGGRSEGGVEMQHGGTMDASTQMWPFMIFDGGTGGGGSR